MSEKATGMFTINQVEDNKSIILIATGTGIAPYMSMLRDNALHRKGKIIIIYGAANSWDLGYQSELGLLDAMISILPTILQSQIQIWK